MHTGRESLDSSTNPCALDSARLVLSPGYVEMGSVPVGVDSAVRVGFESVGERAVLVSQVAVQAHSAWIVAGVEVDSECGEDGRLEPGCEGELVVTVHPLAEGHFGVSVLVDVPAGRQGVALVGSTLGSETAEDGGDDFFNGLVVDHPQVGQGGVRHFSAPTATQTGTYIEHTWELWPAGLGQLTDLGAGRVEYTAPEELESECEWVVAYLVASDGSHQSWWTEEVQVRGEPYEW